MPAHQPHGISGAKSSRVIKGFDRHSPCGQNESCEQRKHDEGAAEHNATSEGGDCSIAGVEKIEIASSPPRAAGWVIGLE
jgi:hypothetical protein